MILKERKLRADLWTRTNFLMHSSIWCESKISLIFVELNHWNGFPQRHLVDTKMPSVKVRSWEPCQKSSTDEQSGLNISHKKGKKMEQSDWHILAKDVNVTDWLCCLTLDLLLYSNSYFPQNLRSTLKLWKESLKPATSASTINIFSSCLAANRGNWPKREKGSADRYCGRMED